MASLTTRVASTGRTAVWLLRRAFYAVMLTNKATKSTKPLWKEFVPKIINKLNETGLTDKPCRIILNYDQQTQDDDKVLVPKSAIIEVFEKTKSVEVL